MDNSQCATHTNDAKMSFMAREFPLTPQAVDPVHTRLRRIATELPVPESIPTLEKLHRYEPVAMRGQPPVVWDHAEGFQVYDAWGNRWIDWSSGVLITNAGPRPPARSSTPSSSRRTPELLTNYCFPSEIRARLVEEAGVDCCRSR